MNLFAPLAGLLGIEVESLVQRVKRDAVSLSAIVFFALICSVFLLVALYNAMVAWIGPIWGPLAIALAALIIALLLWAVLKIIQGNQKAQQVQKRRAHETNALVTTAALTAVPIILRSPAARIVAVPVAAVAAVLLLGKSSGKRDEPK